MENIAPPRIPEKLQLHYQDHEIEAVLKGAKKGNAKSDVYALRDFAIVMVLFDSGVRAAELCRMRVDDVEWRDQSIRVKGKGVKSVGCP